MTTSSNEPSGTSPLHIAAIGTLLLMNVYAPQALLPLLSREFQVSTAQVGTLIGSTTLAIALASPVSGLLADALGRKRVMMGAFALLLLPCLLAANADTFSTLSAARFLQGLLIPLVMVAITAYLVEETPRWQYNRLLTGYVAGTVLGGFLGRLISGLVAHGGDWHPAFYALLLTNLLGLALVWRLPAETHFHPQRSRWRTRVTLAAHLRNPQLLSVCLAGFLILFVLVAVFNTVPFRLAAPPYNLGPGPLGLIFAVYLLGVVVTPATSPVLQSRGPGFVLRAAAGISLLGLGLTLLAPLPVIVVGLALASTGVFMAQAAAQNLVQQSVHSGRSLAGGLYNFAYYGGGAAASVAAGLAFDAGGWPRVVLLCAVAWALLLALSVWVRHRNAGHGELDPRVFPG
ncbi:MFS transporter [Deinococcus sp. Marseille-Q6407]|uniref:MFS transporter n=1 Tax=Deinococcus sp. Marseille-Q6407 TaxID=2969223 RepID=UPI0021BFBADE|nr:MFS transporter [Deinococcus sp. Marseille-Q6407]